MLYILHERESKNRLDVRGLPIVYVHLWPDHRSTSARVLSVDLLAGETGVWTMTGQPIAWFPNTRLHNECWQRAKHLLGPGATISEIARRAQELVARELKTGEDEIERARR